MEQGVRPLEGLLVTVGLQVTIVCEGVPVFVVMAVVGTGDPLPVRLPVRLTVKDAHPLPVGVSEPVRDPIEGLRPIEADPVALTL